MLTRFRLTDPLERVRQCDDANLATRVPFPGCLECHGRGVPISASLGELPVYHPRRNRHGVVGDTVEVGVSQMASRLVFAIESNEHMGEAYIELLGRVVRLQKALEDRLCAQEVSLFAFQSTPHLVKCSEGKS